MNKAIWIILVAIYFRFGDDVDKLIGKILLAISGIVAIVDILGL